MQAQYPIYLEIRCQRDRLRLLPAIILDTRTGRPPEGSGSARAYGRTGRRAATADPDGLYHNSTLSAGRHGNHVNLTAFNAFVIPRRPAIALCRGTISLPRNPKHPTLAPASLARPGHKFLSAGSASRVGHPSSRRGQSRAPNRRRRAANRLTGASIIHPAGKEGVMPKLSTTLHLDMLNDFTRANNRLPARLFRAIKHELTESPIYGLQWGDPETSDLLRFILDRYVRPYVKSDHTALEIGPGGGRWTRYLLDFSKVYAIDYHLELLRELQRNFRRQKNLEFVKNNGADFPGVPDKSIDFLFSFGALVHIELDIIQHICIISNGLSNQEPTSCFNILIKPRLWHN